MAKWLLAVFVASAVGLKLNIEEVATQPNGNAILPDQPAVEGKAVLQTLKSDGEGMAYYGSMFVGGQKQVSIYDTGSFDVVVLSNCKYEASGHNAKCCSRELCPFARYSARISGSNFQASNASLETIEYGSGAVEVASGWDHVSVGDETTDEQSPTKGNVIEKSKVPVKVIVDSKVELFQTTKMTAIVGIGPDLFQERKDRLVNHMNIKRFMVCFQENVDKDGFMTWNDKDRSHDDDWITVPVPAKLYWGVPTTDFMLDNAKAGCEGGCSGIIDTGTSLFTPPSAVVEKLTRMIKNSEIEDCSNIAKFPTFHFKLGGKKFSLPPASYIADSGHLTNFLETFYPVLAIQPLPMRKRDLEIAKSEKEKGMPARAVHTCTLLLSPGDDTPATFGPMVIFGMALFRKYAVQFDLEGDLKDTEGLRKMRFAEAAHDCSGPASGGRFSRDFSLLQKVNIDKLRMSPLQQKFHDGKLLKVDDDKLLMKKPIFRI